MSNEFKAIEKDAAPLNEVLTTLQNCVEKGVSWLSAKQKQRVAELLTQGWRLQVAAELAPTVQVQCYLVHPTEPERRVTLFTLLPSSGEGEKEVAH